MSGYEDFNAFTNFVNKIKEFGLTTSIDDFGTSYSSLNLLTDFNVDIIKLDKSFLDNIAKKHSDTDVIVIKNIVGMINELRMGVIAEGVETAEQAEFLKSINCNMVQGYLYDKPLAHDDFELRLMNKHYEK